MYCSIASADTVMAVCLSVDEIFAALGQLYDCFLLHREGRRYSKSSEVLFLGLSMLAVRKHSGVLCAYYRPVPLSVLRWLTSTVRFPSDRRLPVLFVP